LHSGLPISVVDLDRIEEPLRIAIAAPDASYVFNRSGQEIELKGLLCLHDREGPCANAVKDSQRTKTSEHTRRTLSVVWGTRSLREQTLAAGAWYRQLLARAEASTLDCETRASESSPQSD
jgi:DNA/RNA-binding domain of Phe-tRNA-synthetase-like protein